MRRIGYLGFALVVIALISLIGSHRPDTASPPAASVSNQEGTAGSVPTSAPASAKLGSTAANNSKNPGVTAASTITPTKFPGDLTSVQSGTALAMLQSLVTRAKIYTPTYQRSAFGAAWADVDHNGCDTRNDILSRDLRAISATHCEVSAGTLVSAYTGATIRFTRGKSSSSQVQIDHMVALGDAWATGAAYLSAAQRLKLANDPLNLIAIEGAVNIAKGDRDAASWLPPLAAYRCTYVAHQISVKKAYGLWVTPAERMAMTRVLQGCPGQRGWASTFAALPPVHAG